MKTPKCHSPKVLNVANKSSKGQEGEKVKVLTDEKSSPSSMRSVVKGNNIEQCTNLKDVGSIPTTSPSSFEEVSKIDFDKRQRELHKNCVDKSLILEPDKYIEKQKVFDALRNLKSKWKKNYWLQKDIFEIEKQLGLKL